MRTDERFLTPMSNSVHKKPQRLPSRPAERKRSTFSIGICWLNMQNILEEPLRVTEGSHRSFTKTLEGEGKRAFEKSSRISSQALSGSNVVSSFYLIAYFNY